MAQLSFVPVPWAYFSNMNSDGNTVRSGYDLITGPLTWDRRKLLDGMFQLANVDGLLLSTGYQTFQGAFDHFPVDVGGFLGGIMMIVAVDPPMGNLNQLGHIKPDQIACWRVIYADALPIYHLFQLEINSAWNQNNYTPPRNLPDDELKLYCGMTILPGKAVTTHVPPGAENVEYNVALRNTLFP